MRRNWQIIGILVVLLLIVGVASVALPAVQEQLFGSTTSVDIGLEAENEPVAVDLGGYLLGEELEKIPFLNDAVNGQEVNPLILLTVSMVLIGGAVVTFGLFLALVMRILSRSTTKAFSDPAFQEATKNLENREKEKNKELAKSQPPTEIPDHNRPVWSAYSTIAVFIFFVGVIAFAVGESFNVNISVTVFAGVVTIIAAIAFLFTIRPERFTDAEAGDTASVNWSAIWVAVSGFIFLGIGLGIMIAIRSLAG